MARLKDMLHVYRHQGGAEGVDGCDQEVKRNAKQEQLVLLGPAVAKTSGRV